jgi:hypothetical protein
MTAIFSTIRNFVRGFTRIPQEVEAPRTGLAARIQRVFSAIVDSCFIPMYHGKNFCFKTKLIFSGLDIRNMRHDNLNGLSYRRKFETIEKASSIASRLIAVQASLNPLMRAGGSIDVDLCTRTARNSKIDGRPDEMPVILDHISRYGQLLRDHPRALRSPEEVSDSLDSFLLILEPNQREAFINLLSRFTEDVDVDSLARLLHENSGPSPATVIEDVVKNMFGRPIREHDHIFPDLDTRDAEFIQLLVELSPEVRQSVLEDYHEALEGIDNASKADKIQLYRNLNSAVNADARATVIAGFRTRHGY